MLLIAAICFLVLMFLGVPVAFAMGLAGIAGIHFGSEVPLTLVALRLFSGIDSFVLLAIPFFMLGGELMEKGGISRRLLRLSDSLFGHMRGGVGQVTTVTSASFACISGSSAATTAAVGSIMIPEMQRQNYPKGLAASIQASAGSLGPIIPPSMTMIIFSSLTGLSIGKLFLAGILPGILICMAIMCMTYYFGRKLGLASGNWGGLRAVGRSLISASLSLVMPVIIVGGVVSGVFTATEAGAVSAAYAFIIGVFVYRELSLKDLKDVILRSISMTSMVMLMIASASIFGWILAYEGTPRQVVALLSSITSDPILVIFLIIAFLTVVGMFVETISATIIFAPVLMPVAAAYGIDPIQFALIMVITLVYAGITPPVGGILLLAGGMSGSSYLELLRYVFPYILALYAALALCVFFPFLSVYLPGFVR